MIKVHILDRCELCDGEAYSPGGETKRYIADYIYLPTSPFKRVESLLEI